jgi:hypothetical protein
MAAQDLESLFAFHTALFGCFRHRADSLCRFGHAPVAAEAVASLP